MAQHAGTLSEKDEKRRNDILNGNLYCVVPRICFPLVLYQGFGQLFKLIDNLLAAQISPVSVSAVAYLNQINQLLLAVGGGLAIGGSILVSRSYGAGDYQRVKRLVSAMFVWCGILSLAVIALIPVTPLVLSFFGTPDVLAQEGRGYFIIGLFDLIIIFFNTIYISLERSRGNTKRILVLNIISMVVKFVCTVLFVYVCKTGITMIATAGVIANLCILVPGLYSLFKSGGPFIPEVNRAVFSHETAAPLLSMSFPVMTEKVSFAAGKIVVNSMSAVYGALTVGALGISNNIGGLVTTLQNGVQDGCSSLISQNLGAEKPERALAVFRIALMINLLIGTVGFALTQIFLPQLAHLFSPNDADFAQLIAHIYQYEGSGLIPLAVNATVMALLYGFGYTRLTLVVNFCRVLVFRVPLLWALQKFTSIGSDCVGIVMMASNLLVSALSAVIGIVVYGKIKRRCTAPKTYTVSSAQELEEIFARSLSDSQCTALSVKLEPGLYEGQFSFDGWRRSTGFPPVSLNLTGSGETRTVLSGAHCAREYFKDSVTGNKRGTFRSFTLFVSGPEVHLSRMTIENTAGLPPPHGLGREAGQAVALYADAARLFAEHVALHGHQDTLFASPLPCAERELGGFAGPRRDDARLPSVQIYNRCTISGTIDFIFGGASALFNHCTVNVLPLQKRADFSDNSECARYIAAPCADYPAAFANAAAYVNSASPVNTAASESAGTAAECGFVFYRCKIRQTGERYPHVGIKSAHTAAKKQIYEEVSSIYLARPWRPYGQCSYIACSFDAPELAVKKWHGWKTEDDLAQASFSLYERGDSLHRVEINSLLQKFRPYG